MADIYDVDGPIQVQFNATPISGGTFVDVGHTLPTDRPQWDERPLEEPLMSDEFGEEPEDFVFLGSELFIQFTCVKLTLLTIDLLRQKMKYGVTNPEDSGTIGTRAAPTAAMFQIKLIPTIEAQIIKTFINCKLAPDGMQEFGKGNQATRYAFAIRALRDPTTPFKFWTEAPVPAP